jgi:hypothetical protein
MIRRPSLVQVFCPGHRSLGRKAPRMGSFVVHEIRAARRLGKQRVISQELSPISVLSNKGRCTPRQAYKSLAIDTRKNHPQNQRYYRLRRIVYSPANVSVLPNKGWCTPQQGMVYSPTRDGVLPSKYWCTFQRFLVYSSARNSVLPDKFSNVICLQKSTLYAVRIGASVLFM